MSNTQRLPQLTIAFALVVALLAASAPARAQQADPANAVPVSQYNARWPREPASGPLPPVAVPEQPTPAEPRNHPVVPVVGGLLLLALCTGAATGLRVRPRRRRAEKRLSAAVR